MKRRRFYNKTYEHPAIRYSRYWKMDESFGYDIYQFLRLEGWGLTRVQKHIKRYLNIDISSKSLRHFMDACLKYERITQTSLKKGQIVGESFLEKTKHNGDFSF